MPASQDSHSNSEHLHIRCSATVLDRLDDIVHRLRSDGAGTTRSQVARMILLEHIGVDDPVAAKVEEMIHTMYAAMEEAFGMILQDTKGNLHEYLRHAISKPKRTDPGYPQRVAGGRRRQSVSG